MPLTSFAVDDGSSLDGLRLHANDGTQRVEAFISRRVMDSWVDPVEPYASERVCFANNTMRSESEICPRSNGSSGRNTSAAQRSIVSILSWTSCWPTSLKAARCST